MFDLDEGWRLHEQVVMRPERFGALAYHFDNRRLTFLKSRKLFAVVEQLSSHDTARSACAGSGVTDAEMPAFTEALATLARRDMIRRA